MTELARSYDTRLKVLKHSVEQKEADEHVEAFEAFGDAYEPIRHHKFKEFSSQKSIEEVVMEPDEDFIILKPYVNDPHPEAEIQEKILDFARTDYSDEELDKLILSAVELQHHP